MMIMKFRKGVTITTILGIIIAVTVVFVVIYSTNVISNKAKHTTDGSIEGAENSIEENFLCKQECENYRIDKSYIKRYQNKDGCEDYYAKNCP
jgi:mannitol-specific phosphotransferase system IIBC component